MTVNAMIWVSFFFFFFFKEVAPSFPHSIIFTTVLLNPFCHCCYFYHVYLCSLYNLPFSRSLRINSPMTFNFDLTNKCFWPLKSFEVTIDSQRRFFNSCAKGSLLAVPTLKKWELELPQTLLTVCAFSMLRYNMPWKKCSFIYMIHRYSLKYFLGNYWQKRFWLGSLYKEL